MEIKCAPTPHPQLLNMLFAYKSVTTPIFKDVLGLHDITHVAITQITSGHDILVFSSTPSLEFNLFSTKLWQYDATYQPNWFQTGLLTPWEALYAPAQYDELYHIRQIAHHLAGLSLAVAGEASHTIYSVASSRSTPERLETFMNNQDVVKTIGRYCNNLLTPYFMEVASMGP